MATKLFNNIIAILISLSILFFIANSIAQSGLRTYSSKLSIENIVECVEKHNFFDNNLNPEGNFENDFVDNRDGTITDRATGLMWEKEGSKKETSFPRTDKYINSLNTNKFSGYQNWRLPTINELLSLINPLADDNFCMEPVFSSDQKWIWSSDTRSKKSAWSMDIQMGFVTCSDFFDYNYVKGVCSVK